MKKVTHFFFFFSILCFCTVCDVIAQNLWEPVKLDVAGHSKFKNVEVFFQKGLCNKEEVIFVRFINNNKYPVTVKWYDAVLTQGNSWVKKDDSTAKKFLDISAAGEIKGECSSTEHPDCTIKLKDYLEKLSDYNLYAMYRFEVIENK